MQLLVIAILAGTLGVIGCSTDSGGGGGSGTAGTGGNGNGNGGNGGNGGTVSDPCTGGFCDDPSEAKTACGVAVDYCKSDECCSGAGGAGGSVDPTDAQCDALGPKICMIDFGGAGGTGGSGGSGGQCTNGELCCIEVCASDHDLAEPLRQVCLNEYNNCIDLGNTEAQCKGPAEETCTL
jgi:hypothetical protein